MRHHLYGASQEITPPLSGDNRGVYLSRGNIRSMGQINIDEPLIMPQVKVGLSAVIGDEYLAVLVGRHGARINIEVGVQLLHGDRDAAAFQDPADRGNADALSLRS